MLSGSPFGQQFTATFFVVERSATGNHYDCLGLWLNLKVASGQLGVELERIYAMPELLLIAHG